MVHELTHTETSPGNPNRSSDWNGRSWGTGQPDSPAGHGGPNADVLLQVRTDGGGQEVHQDVRTAAV